MFNIGELVTFDLIPSGTSVDCMVMAVDMHKKNYHLSPIDLSNSPTNGGNFIVDFSRVYQKNSNSTSYQPQLPGISGQAQSGQTYNSHSIMDDMFKAMGNEIAKDLFCGKPGYSATVKLYFKCTCGTASLHGGGKHSDWCDIKE